MGNKKIDEETGLPINPDGTVTVYHHTSRQAAESILGTGQLKSDGEPDVQVTSRRETDTGYGDTAVPIRIDPSKLILDDEFPGDGRKDFRINVRKPKGSLQVEVEEFLNRMGI